IALTQVYAYAAEGFFDKKKDDVTVLFCDAPVPAAAVRDYFARKELVDAGKLHCVQQVVDANKQVINFEVRDQRFGARPPGGGSNARYAERTGYLEVELDRVSNLQNLLRVRELVFARQAARLVARVAALPERDRATPIVDAARAAELHAHRLVLETPDTNEGKTLSAFTRRFAPILERALREQQVLISAPEPQQTLHVFFPDRSSALL